MSVLDLEQGVLALIFEPYLLVPADQTINQLRLWSNESLENMRNDTRSARVVFTFPCSNVHWHMLYSVSGVCGVGVGGKESRDPSLYLWCPG